VFETLPGDLPEPEDDGAADHLVGARLPSVALASTGGRLVRLDMLGAGRTVVYCYPKTGRPGVPLPEGWDAIPGARGCSAEACAFRDRHQEFTTRGVTVFGLSTQPTDYQQEMAARLHVPFEVLSDADLRLASALRLPTFTAAGETLLKRLTMVITGGRIEHVFYPVFPPDRHAVSVEDWLRRQR
jgi:peroxiredoxin